MDTTTTTTTTTTTITTGTSTTSIVNEESRILQTEPVQGPIMMDPLILTVIAASLKDENRIDYSESKSMRALIQQIIGRSLAKLQLVEMTESPERIQLSKTLYINSCHQLKLIVAFVYHLRGQKVTGHEEFHVTALIKEYQKKEQEDKNPNRWFQSQRELVTNRAMVDDLCKTFGYLCRPYKVELCRIYSILYASQERKVTVKEDYYLTFQTV